jgi:hypothetical protein
MKSRIRIVVMAFGGLVLLWLGGDILMLWLDAAFSEAPISFIWREQGGFRGHFHFVTDLELAADPDSVVSESAASRLQVRRQCDKQDGMLKLLDLETRPNTRLRLLQTLAACGSQKAIPLFREALHSGNPSLVVVGAQSLGMLKARDAISELEAVVEQGVSQCDGAAALALSQMGERRVAYPWAVKMLSAEKPKNDPNSVDSFRRIYSGQILENLGTAADIPLLERNKGSLGVYTEYQEKAILGREATHPSP